MWGQKGPQSPAEKKSNDSKGLRSSPSAVSMDSYRESAWLRGLLTLKLPNQRCQTQHFEIADFLFGRALREERMQETSRQEPWLNEAVWHDAVFTGRWERLGQPTDVLEPATGQVISRIGLVGAEEISRSAARAREAQRAWAETHFEDRARVLRKAAELAETHMADLADWIVRDSGSVRAKAEFELGITIRSLREAAAMPSQPQGLVLPSSNERISLCRRMPLGVIGVIAPFNFPLYLAMRAVAPALAVGNAVIVKPDPRTSISGGVIIAQLLAEAGLPEGVLHVLPGAGDAGAALCSDPNVAMIAFTGSTSAGRKVGELAGRHLKKVSLVLQLSLRTG